MRKTLIPATFLMGLAMFVPARPALAVSKEIIQLQTQVQTLQDMLQQMQRSNSEQMGVLQHMLQQTSDSMTQMSQQINALGAKVDAEGQNNQLSGQIQGLNDSIDELKSHLNRIDTTLGNIQSQMQNVSAPPAGSVGAAAPGAAPSGAPPTAQQGAQQGTPQDNQAAPQDNQGAPQGNQQSPSGVSVPLSGGNQPQAMQSGGAPPLPSGTAPAQAPPVGQLYTSAVSDYNGARYDLAGGEFSDILKYYPQSKEAGNASFYQGEIAYRQGLYPAAIKSYDMVLTQHPGSSKAPAALLRKGEAELASAHKEAGIRDLRALVRRYPVTPEGAQARSLLNGMGVRLTASKPSPYNAQ